MKQWQYIGNGNFIVGIPARDLSAEEARTIGIAKIKKSGLYRQPAQARGFIRVEEQEIENDNLRY